ncbi:STY4534 family ICE replication protein [Gallibacterium sp. AGMB14963]|uniref:STY4534 family ICE replication protein n=1 Tax=Gallibacterium TaxID=155493 RepID=UPI0022F1966C|nr:STY4534 family ICE replication protein [Gallibacterium sp. AGMB14963]MDA3978064.1 STY4534 family ICE replication protein [Gallibacterium sp. AGMB14963]
MNTQTQQAKTYFNLHTTGIGYLNNIREVKPKKGNTFWACRIAALAGDSTTPEYRYFDVNVVGALAEKLVKNCQKAVSEGHKMLISFVISDLWADLYTVNKDSSYHKKGDTAVSLKGRLIRINMIKKDGVKVYPKVSTEAEQQTAPVQNPEEAIIEALPLPEEILVQEEDGNELPF